MSRIKMQDLLELRDNRNFRENYIEPALRDGLIRMKYPESPNHPKQRYLLTSLGEEPRGNWEISQTLSDELRCPIFSDN